MKVNKTFWMLMVMLLFIFIIGCTKQTEVDSGYSFAIYLVEDVNISEAIKVNLRDLKLAEKPIISDLDLLSYNWQTHELKVEESLLKKLGNNQELVGQPFVVVANGERVYLGAFYSYYMSASLDIPVILIAPISNEVLTIEPGYPSYPINYDPAKDKRKDQRVHHALEKTGKITD